MLQLHFSKCGAQFLWEHCVRIIDPQLVECGESPHTSSQKLVLQRILQEKTKRPQ